ncbi:hypothetical protein BGZ94_008338 [Podila epigama]|nr:hypothetical protein BGZ94_008338 [Podila epigama]
MLAKYYTIGAIATFIALAAKALADNVLSLDPNTFDPTIGSKPALVEFYAPWCGHCKNLAPVYEELGDAFSATNDKVLIVKVDADQHRSLGSRFGVKGFPTIKWFPNGLDSSPEDYNGGRDLESLASFVTQKSGVKSSIKKVISEVQVVTDANFEEKVLNSKKNVLVEFYAPWCGHCKNLAPTYEKVGADFAREKDVVIAKVDATVEKLYASKYGVNGYPTIKFFSPDGSVSEYQGGRSEQDFITFINKKAGTQRGVGGRLSPEAGRVEELDAVAKKLSQATTEEEKKALSEEGIKVATRLQDDNETAKHYLRVFAKVLVEPEFVATEAARLARISASGTISPSKLDDFAIRENVLAAFAVTKEKEQEEAKPAKEEL